MDTIDGMRTVVAVIETGSFTAAAERLGISKSLASKYVGRVEEQLGVTLFNRTTRKLSITQLGREYHQQAQQVLEQFDKLYRQLPSNNKGATGPLRVTASHWFAEELLSPLIPEFHSCFPNILIDMVVTNQKLDFVEQGIDIAFRAGELDNSTLNYRKIMSLKSSVYASKVLVSQYQTKRKRLGIPCLIDTNLHPHSRWPVEKSTNRNTSSVSVQPVFKSNSPRLIRQLTLSGVGASYQPDIIAKPYVLQGRLQKMDIGYQALQFPLNALYRGGEYQPERVKVFLDFVTDKLGEKA